MFDLVPPVLELGVFAVKLSQCASCVSEGVYLEHLLCFLAHFDSSLLSDPIAHSWYGNLSATLFAILRSRTPTTCEVGRKPIGMHI